MFEYVHAIEGGGFSVELRDGFMLGHIEGRTGAWGARCECGELVVTDATTRWDAVAVLHLHHTERPGHTTRRRNGGRLATVVVHHPEHAFTHQPARSC